MRALLVYPKFPKSFWSFEKFLELVSRKVLLPPLGMVTVAAILPQTWEFQLVDRNIRTVTEEEWAWADIVILSAMIVQQDDLLEQIREAKRRGKRVAVGGPYPTSLPEDSQSAGADYLILDEGEITLPLFVDALERGELSGVFRAGDEKPDVTLTPIPRFDLLDMKEYQYMSVQFSRGCPFQCEFCDIIVLYGRKPRTKTPEQLLAELETLYQLGWRRNVFLVDDNFIGNKRNVKCLLKELRVWQAKHNYPFMFMTEASVDLAQDFELMQAMVECNFKAVFLGIETPDVNSLSVTKKFQNTRDPLEDAVDKIIRAGLIPLAGFILGFDGEKTGSGDRIVEFVERTAISQAFFTLLQALPDTALWHRLEKENRLLTGNATINQTNLINFIPTRPLEEIVNEYISAFWELFEPERYLDRTYRCFLKIGRPQTKIPLKKPSRSEVQAMLLILWRQGVVRKTRWQFWYYLFQMLRRGLSISRSYLIVCGINEHYLEYRQIVRDQVKAQLCHYLAEIEQKQHERSLASL